MSDKRARGRRPTAEEKALWRHVTRDVVPLRAKKARIPEADYATELRETAEPSFPRENPETRALPALPRIEPAKPAPADLEVGRPAGVDKRNATRLRRGKLPIEARVDLHGMTQERAFRALNGFILRSHEAGLRCVLVITGKGLRPDGGVGVLRSAVPRWLNQSPCRERVLAVTHATQNDGGEGAYYVMLKRKK